MSPEARAQCIRSVSAGLFVLAAVFGTGCSRPADRASAPTERKQTIDYFQKKVESDPDHYPSHASLAAALLEQARETGDLDALAAARKHAERSIEIQPNLEAFKVMARLEGFEHRFEKSIEWGNKAAGSTPDSVADGEISAILVDAYLGLGKPEDARRVLDSLTEDGFHKRAALGNYLKATAKPGEAAQAFSNASEAALRENAAEAQAWAEVMAAGVWIDAREQRKALFHLENASKISPGSKTLSIHWAEYYELEGAPAISAEKYLGVLERSDDPEVHHRLYKLFKAMGNGHESSRHFGLAEKGFRRILAAGHIYALGPLAQLLCDAGKNPDEVKQLSAENLKYKRDAEARATERCLKDKTPD